MKILLFKTRFLLFASLALSMVGCNSGRNSTSGSLSSSSSAADNSVLQNKLSSSANLPLLANENGSFTVAAGSEVLYGADTHFNQLTVSGTVDCSNAVFGDPDFGVVKACYLVSSGAASTAPSGSAGSLLANENGSFTVAAGSVVKYGADTHFTQLTVSGNVSCSNDVFGDPDPGVVKACYLVSATPSVPAGAPLASENGSFTVAAGSVVKYGADTHFTQLTVSGTVSCSNAIFGDPDPGVVKACYLVSAGSAPSVPTTPTTPTTPSAPAAGTLLVSEGGSFTVAAGSVISYGADTHFTQVTVSGTAACSNSVFGDPDPGVKKACYLISGSVTTPVVTPTPSPTPIVNPPPVSTAGSQDQGTHYIGRWLLENNTATAKHSAAAISYRFKGTGVSVDIQGYGGWAIFVDGVKAQRFYLGNGFHPNTNLVSGLSNNVHTVTMVREADVRFDGNIVSNPVLANGGSWQAFDADTAKVVEVIGDSNSTGTCLLGDQLGYNDNPETSSASMAWPYLLQTNLASKNINVEVANLATWGTSAQGQANDYKYTVPNQSTSLFTSYSDSRKVQVAIMLIGMNDAGGGGQTALGSPVSANNLSDWQKGIYSLMSQIWAKNPDALIVQAEYIGEGSSWAAGYSQVNSLFNAKQNSQISHVAVPNVGNWNYCGHPSPSKQSGWASTVTDFVVANGIVK